MNMNIEQIRAINPTGIEFVDLHRKMFPAERDQYKPASFTAGDLHKTPYIVFDGRCVTHEIEGNLNAMGFIGGIPELPATIYDKQDDCFILCYKICFNTIVFEFLQNKKYNE